MISFALIWSFGQFFYDSQNTLVIKDVSNLIRHKIIKFYNNFPLENDIYDYYPYYKFKRFKNWNDLTT